MAQRTRPAKLHPGARIGVVAPCYWMEDEPFRRAVGVFEGLGYEVVPGESTRLREHRFAGTPEQRAADIMAMFEDPAIDAIVCARGGYGGNRVLPLLDYESIARHPKIFVGYSDVTGYLTSIAQRAGLVTFHGPMLSTFGKRTEAYNLDVFQRVLSGADAVRIDAAAACPGRTLRPGHARGELWGGNLTLVVERLATAGQVDARGAILLLEDVDEQLYAFERMLLHLRNAGTLDGIRGLVVGELLEMGDKEVPFGKDADAIVLDVCGDLDIPIVTHFPCGHGACQATLPIGHEIELHADADAPYLVIPRSPVA
jgi:muramoyltetrapeptide carboxypeptidase